VRAVLFDLDGTLIDTEEHTDLAIGTVMAQYGITGFALPATLTRGRTWESVAREILARTQLHVGVPELAAELLAHWVAGTANANPIPGAPAAIRTAAGAGLRLGVVSSSPRSVIDYFLNRLAIGDCVDSRARIGAGEVRATKPAPEGYLLAARVLETDPADCLVFEDSNAGLLAARAAGMRSVFITCCAENVSRDLPLATVAYEHYEILPSGFWTGVASGAHDLRPGARA
jgi:beta-phosphoglucomutase-like phosphatase (HAD superfamily)